MTTRSKIVTSMLAATVLSLGLATAQAAERPGGATAKPVVTSQQVAAKAKKVTKGEAVAQANATANEMIQILHKYGL
jgi:hypothetical protein